MRVKTIAYKNLPARPPILLTCVVWLLLDRFAAPEWAWGVAASLAAIVWALVIYAMTQQDNIDIFEAKKP